MEAVRKAMMGVAAACFMLLTGCGASENYAPAAPPRATDAIVFPNEPSHIAVDLKVSLADLEQALERELPRELWQIDRPGSECVASRKVDLALFNPDEYARILTSAHHEIAAFGGAFLPGRPAKEHGLFVQGAHAAAVARKGAKFRHLGQNHCHDFEAIHFIFGILPRLARLHDENAKLFANALDRNAQERGVKLFPGFGHVAKALFLRGVCRVDGQTCAGDAADQTLAQAQPGLVVGLSLVFVAARYVPAKCSTCRPPEIGRRAQDAAGGRLAAFALSGGHDC